MDSSFLPGGAMNIPYEFGCIALSLITWWILWFIAPRLTGPRKSIVTFVILLIFSASSLCTFRIWRSEKSMSHTIQSTTPLRVGPDTIYGSCGMLKAGDTVTIEETRGTWLRVCARTRTGWIPVDAITDEKPA